MALTRQISIHNFAVGGEGFSASDHPCELSAGGTYHSHDMSTISKGDLVRYKTGKYRVGYAGPTKFGERAKLEFLDGSKSFWTDLSKVSLYVAAKDASTASEYRSKTGGRSGGRGGGNRTGGICDECGEPRRNLRPKQDMSGIWGRVCGVCAQDDCSFC